MAAAFGEDAFGSAAALLTAGADVNAFDRHGATALRWTLKPQEPSDRRPVYWWAPFRIYAQKMLGLLLNAGAEINLADDQGITPLMLAAQNPNANFIPPLLRAGADPKAVDRTGMTAKDHARPANRDWPQVPERQ